jgi:hypothetical protein
MERLTPTILKLRGYANDLRRTRDALSNFVSDRARSVGSGKLNLIIKRINGECRVHPIQLNQAAINDITTD